MNVVDEFRRKLWILATIVGVAAILVAAVTVAYWLTLRFP